MLGKAYPKFKKFFFLEQKFPATERLFTAFSGTRN